MGDIKKNDTIDNEGFETDARRELFGKLANIQRMSRFLRHHGHGPKHGPGDPSRGQGRVISLLKLRDGLSTREIADVCGIRVSSLNETLSRMERDGLIERRASEEDKRVQQIFLTEQGQAVQPPMRLPEKVLAGFSDEELEQFGSYLDRVAEALEAELGDEGKAMMAEMRESRRKLGFHGEPGFGPGPRGPRCGHGPEGPKGGSCHRGPHGGPRHPHFGC